MTTLVIYKSKTGFSKKYAEIIAKRLECQCTTMEEVTTEILTGSDIVIFGGGLYAGRINGLKQMMERVKESGIKEFIVFATGGTPNEAKEDIQAVWKNNLSPEELAKIPHFYMQSGISYENMKLGDKMLMKMMSAILNAKKDKNEQESGFAQAIASSYDISSEALAEPLIDYVIRRG